MGSAEQKKSNQKSFWLIKIDDIVFIGEINGVVENDFFLSNIVLQLLAFSLLSTPLSFFDFLLKPFKRDEKKTLRLIVFLLSIFISGAAN